jgi:hypothetical protein
LKTTCDLSPDRAEAFLRPITKYWIVELLDLAGTTPDDTCAVVTAEEPDLVSAVGPKRVLSLCDELHRSEDASQSDWYAARLYQFDQEYFDGRLADWSVRAVYDVSWWRGEPNEHMESSHIDLVKRQILLGVTHYANCHGMDYLLIKCMAHAVTGTTSHDDERWLQEMARLRSAGAPVKR